RFYKIKLPDAIVAATAISYNVPLLTADKEFNKIKGLNLCLLNPIANQ
ncbi:MAG: PIN domain-containing protein, partial [Spirochaetaceae bacterium]|nr:PIN domain-containing protein [Spirochaetaceae bacterium]